MDAMFQSRIANARAWRNIQHCPFWANVFMR
jgi:hypothetical protein